MAKANAPLTVLESRPLTDRAREALLAAISRGDFADGRLPTEAQLAILLGVSRTTIRGALQSLSAEGIISRRRGTGTRVNEHAMRASMTLNRLIPFARLVEQAGQIASTEIGTTTIGRATTLQARNLGICRGARTVVARRLLQAAGRPVIAIVDVIPRQRLLHAPEQVNVCETTFDFVRENVGTEIEYATSEIIPRRVTADAPGGLKLDLGIPFIELHEIHYTREQEPIAYSVVDVDDRFVRLSITRRGS